MIEALRSLVLKYPGDVEPRAVLADYLVQRGDPRGEFITLQTALLGHLSPDARETARRRVATLLAEHEAEWSTPIKPWGLARFRGGFIDAIRAKASDFVRHAATLLAVEPVRSVRLFDTKSADVQQVAELACLKGLRRLVFEGSYAPASVVAIATSPHLKNLEALTLSCADGAFAEALVEGQLRSLVTLTLTGTNLGDQGATALAKCEALSKLERLFLTRADISDEGLTALAGSRWLSKLTLLTLGGNDGITDEGVMALAKSKSLTALTHLELGGTGISDEGVEALAKSKALKGLKRLDLRQTEASAGPFERRKEVRVDVSASY
ncbi:MAG: TIGR02996 domain-containing protein [Polyangiaceae bacterium]